MTAMNQTRTTPNLHLRPPELLLQTDEHCDYGPAIDMWSAGCVFAKLHGKRVMEGKDKADQMYKIWDLCGSANEFNWPGVSKLPKYDEFKPLKPMKRCVREVLSDLDPYALELLDRMLTHDPSKRISAKEAPEEAYFSTDPPPSDPKSLPKYESSHGSWVLSGKDSSDGGPHPDHKVQGRGSCTSSPCTSQGHVLQTDASSTHDASPGAVGDSYGVNARPAPR
ncbi:cyclin-dependent kinase C-2-like isoform X2 [Magnolia sinica]|uniref:cyclin-dependent kinase C-2-like isoform X2 n=1 Tax=Magnolia sinica TaxID=86752 RepID=UPI002657C0B5|nr:cyclin-dependent kinase C-2-like isoform X2 [Magnolia sinica]